MLIEFCVLNRNHRVDEVAGQLIVLHRLAVLDVDLTEDLVVSIEDQTRRFHLFEFAQIECRRLALEVGGKNGNVNYKANEEHRSDAERGAKLWPGIPWWPEPIARRYEVWNWHSKAVGARESVAKLR